MAESLTRYLPDAGATAQAGTLLARALVHGVPQSLVIYFDGDLGAGKTSLIRALLAGLGHGGRVPSPTYTLVEPYLLDRYRAYHVDLYRLRHPGELDDLGLADELGPVDEAGRGSLLLAEWPSRGAGRLPAPDLLCELGVEGSGRRLRLAGRSPAGLQLVRQLSQTLPVDS